VKNLFKFVAFFVAMPEAWAMDARVEGSTETI